MPDKHRSYVPTSNDERERLTRQERERLAGLHWQVKRDIASIRYRARDGEVRDLERKYKIGR